MVNASSDPPAYTEQAAPGHSTREHNESDTDSEGYGPRTRLNDDFFPDEDAPQQWIDLAALQNEDRGNQRNVDEDTLDQPFPRRGGGRRNQNDSDEDTFDRPRPRQGGGRRYQDSDSKDMSDQPHPRRAGGRGGRGGELSSRPAGPRLNFGNQRPGRRPPRRHDDFAIGPPSGVSGYSSPSELDRFAMMYSTWCNNQTGQLRELYYYNHIPYQEQTFPPKFRALYEFHLDTGVELMVLQHWVRSRIMVQYNNGNIHVDCNSISPTHRDMMQASSSSRLSHLIL